MGSGILSNKECHHAFVLRLPLVALFLSVSGCPSFDELPPCQQKRIACQNSCYKAGGSPACTECCGAAEEACMKGEVYSFFWCPNK